MSNALAKICAGVGVELVDRRAEYEPGQTDAQAMVAHIYRQHGEGHLVMLFRTFVDSSPANAAAMHEPVLEAVSEIMRLEPAWVASGMRWLEAFDNIDLGAIYLEAKALRLITPTRSGVITLVYRELRKTFCNMVPITPAPAKARNRPMPIENDLLFSPRAIAKFLEMSSDQCRPLIADGSIPTFTVPGAGKTRCARKSTLNALWSAYEESATTRKAAAR